MKGAPDQLNADHFAHYSEITKAQKVLKKSRFRVIKKKSNEAWSVDDAVLMVKPLTQYDQVVYEVEIKPKEPNHYKLKLISDFTGFFFLRFDSSGNSHYNQFDNIPLELRQVPTPHFHGYDAFGKAYAYRTALIEQDDQKFTDVVFGIEHFFAESRISPPAGTRVEVDYQVSLIEPKVDPLAGIQF